MFFWFFLLIHFKNIYPISGNDVIPSCGVRKTIILSSDGLDLDAPITVDNRNVTDSVPVRVWMHEIREGSTLQLRVSFAGASASDIRGLTASLTAGPSVVLSDVVLMSASEEERWARQLAQQQVTMRAAGSARKRQIAMQDPLVFAGEELADSLSRGSVISPLSSSVGAVAALAICRGAPHCVVASLASAGLMLLTSNGVGAQGPVTAGDCQPGNPRIDVFVGVPRNRNSSTVPDPVILKTDSCVNNGSCIVRGAPDPPSRFAPPSSNDVDQLDSLLAGLDHCFSLGSSSGMDLRWAINESHIDFALIGPSSNGWQAVGISTDGSMASGGAGSDLFVSFVSDGAQPVVLDTWATSQAVPEIDSSQDLQLDGGGEISGQLIVRFSRPLQGDGVQDRDVDPAAGAILLWAAGTLQPTRVSDQSPWTYSQHTASGRGALQLKSWSTDHWCATQSPTPVPTPVPTAVPTPLPPNETGAPTPQPSPQPTPVPPPPGPNDVTQWFVDFLGSGRGADGCAVLDAAANFKLWWQIDDGTQTITLAVHAAVAGWMAVGLSGDGSMSGGAGGSDMLVAFVDGAGAGQAADAWTDSRLAPQTDVDRGGTNGVAGSVSGNWQQSGSLAVVRMTRALAAGDASYDRALTPDTPQILIWALAQQASSRPQYDGSSLSSFTKHDVTGSLQVNWRAVGCAAPPTASPTPVPTAVPTPLPPNETGAPTPQPSPQPTFPTKESLASSYDHCVTLSQVDPTFRVHWTISGGLINFLIWALTDGWIGLGVGTNDMSNTDMIIGWTGSSATATCGGNGCLRDAWSSSTTEPQADASNDLTVESLFYESGYTVLQFSRPLDTGDPQDVVIGGVQAVAGALHSTSAPADLNGMLSRHTARYGCNVMGSACLSIDWSSCGECCGGSTSSPTPSGGSTPSPTPGGAPPAPTPVSSPPAPTPSCLGCTNPSCVGCSTCTGHGTCDAQVCC